MNRFGHGLEFGLTICMLYAPVPQVTGDRELIIDEVHRRVDLVLQHQLADAVDDLYAVMTQLQSLVCIVQVAATFNRNTIQYKTIGDTLHGERLLCTAGTAVVRSPPGNTWRPVPGL